MKSFNKIISCILLISCTMNNEIKISNYKDFNLYNPKNSSINKAPLIVYLHGAGGYTADDKSIYTEYYLKEDTISFFLLTINGESGADGSYWDPDEIINTINLILKQNNIEKNQIYLTGISRGAFGTLNTAARYPNYFAAIIPIAGGISNTEDIVKLQYLPIWIFHNSGDKIVPVTYSIIVQTQLEKISKFSKLTIYDVNLENDFASHNAWTATYRNPIIYKWLLEKHAQFRL